MSDELADILIADVVVAKAFGIGVTTVRDWVKAGRIPAPVVNRHKCKRWSKNEIESTIERMKREARKEAAA